MARETVSITLEALLRVAGHGNPSYSARPLEVDEVTHIFQAARSEGRTINVDGNWAFVYGSPTVGKDGELLVKAELVGDPLASDAVQQRALAALLGIAEDEDELAKARTNAATAAFYAVRLEKGES